MVGIGTASNPLGDDRPFWPRPFWPPRNWWLALAATLVLAGALRFPGYDFSLPFMDQPDEAFFALAGQLIIDFGTAKSFGFPPLSTRYHQCLLHPIALLSRSGPAAGERRLDRPPHRDHDEPGHHLAAGIIRLPRAGQDGRFTRGSVLGHYSFVCGEKPLGNGGDLRHVFLHTRTLPHLRRDALPTRKLDDPRHLCVDLGHPVQIPRLVPNTGRALCAFMGWAHLEASGLGKHRADGALRAPGCSS